MAARSHGDIGRLVRDAAFTLLFAVIAVVSAVALVKTVVRPFQTGSYGVAQWALFAVTVVGSTLAFVRSVRFYASLSALARARPTRSEAETPASPEPPQPGRRLHPLLDDLTWAAIALGVAAINALAVWAVVATLAALFGDSETPTGWLLWQLALLTAALAGLARFTNAAAAELRDRSRRRRRNLVHVITGKLVSWPGESSAAAPGRQWKRRAAGATAAAALAAASFASASGPLLDPVPDRAGSRADERPGQGGSPTAPPQGAAPPAQSQTAPPEAGDTDGRSRAPRTRPRPRGGPDSAHVPPAVTPLPPTPPALGPPPAALTPGPPPQTTQPPPKRRDGRARKRRRREADDRRQPDDRRQTTPTTPTPSPTPTIPTPPPAPIPTPVPTVPTPTTPSPDPDPPCDPDEPPGEEPPCEPWPPVPAP